MPDLPLAIVPHPFGSRTREEVRTLAHDCVQEVLRILAAAKQDHNVASSAEEASARLVEAPEPQEAFDAWCRERKLSDGLPLLRPTPERVERFVRAAGRDPRALIGRIAPSFGAATVERIAINAAMAGCDPRALPVLIAAVEAMCDPAFNLQGVQTTTNPAAPWLIVNGPIAAELGMNAGINCLGSGNWANAGIGRALRLVLQNLGGGVAGVMDRATQGQPGKYSFCCAENEADNPWEPLNVERGQPAGTSAVTVVATAGTLNMNSHSKVAGDLIKVFADTLAHPTSNDYWYAGAPFVILAPEHAQVLHRAGLTKAELKRRLWDESRMSAARLSAKDFTRPEYARARELGVLTHDTAIPITTRPEDIGIIVAGGPGTHSVYVPGYGNSRPVTRRVGELAAD
ncbi:MAG: hypothetical protein IT531_00890 [Burkholderiales bacterium]|nr:hypothetical protein [Burkholderiales bacterium]